MLYEFKQSIVEANTVEDRTSAKNKIITMFEDFLSSDGKIDLASLSTIDGFNIYFTSRDDVQIEQDKVAALSSSLCSLSDVSARQIINNDFKIATVETRSGNVLFLRTQYLKRDCVLCIATQHGMTLGEARFISFRLADKISFLE